MQLSRMAERQLDWSIIVVHNDEVLHQSDPKIAYVRRRLNGVGDVQPLLFLSDPAVDRGKNRSVDYDERILRREAGKKLAKRV